MSAPNLLEPTESGLYCAAGDFFVDPWQPVERAIVTHAHSDHAARGCGRYLTSGAGAGVLRARMGEDALIESAEYGDSLTWNGIQISLHPAGHILGSAQVRLEYQGAVWVASGDYKVEADPTCAPFEPLRCHVFVSESTFALPIYRWSREAEIFESIRAWWRGNQEAGKASILYAYALGKAQRVIAGLGTEVCPIYTHGAVEVLNQVYRASGVDLPPTSHVGGASVVDWTRALVIAPPSAQGTPWLRKFGAISSGFVSGWMQIRGARRRRTVDRGFVLSDHADWPSLLAAIDATGAEQIWLTHGYTAVLAHWLREHGRDAGVMVTRYEGERDDAPAETLADDAGETAGPLFNAPLE
jgi:putative mRNA 3-end processing factor